MKVEPTLAGRYRIREAPAGGLPHPRRRTR
jgi:hypothetical protein